MGKFEEDFERYLVKHDARNRELLAKYRQGQKVKIDLGDGLVVATITDVYEDFNGGSDKDIFVNIVVEEDGV
jgi:hypothetical protein